MRLARLACVCLAAVSTVFGGTGPGEEAALLERVGRLEEECAALRLRVVKLEGLLEQLAAESRQLRGEVMDLYRMQAEMAASARGADPWVHLPPVALVPGAISGWKSAASEDCAAQHVSQEAVEQEPISMWGRDGDVGCPELYDPWDAGWYGPVPDPDDSLAAIDQQEPEAECGFFSSFHGQDTEEPLDEMGSDWAAQSTGEGGLLWESYAERYDHYGASSAAPPVPEADIVPVALGECAGSDQVSPASEESAVFAPVTSVRCEEPAPPQPACPVLWEEPAVNDPETPACEAPEALAPAAPVCEEPAPPQPACPVLWEEPEAPAPVSPPSEPIDTACEGTQWIGYTYGHDDAPDQIMGAMELSARGGAQECQRVETFGAVCVVASAGQAACELTVTEER